MPALLRGGGALTTEHIRLAVPSSAIAHYNAGEFGVGCLCMPAEGPTSTHVYTLIYTHYPVYYVVIHHDSHVVVHANALPWCGIAWLWLQNNR